MSALFESYLQLFSHPPSTSLLYGLYYLFPNICNPPFVLVGIYRMEVVAGNSIKEDCAVGISRCARGRVLN